MTVSELTASNMRQGLIGLAQVLSRLALAVALIVWFRRAYRNLPALGESPAVLQRLDDLGLVRDLPQSGAPQAAEGPRLASSKPNGRCR